MFSGLAEGAVDSAELVAVVERNRRATPAQTAAALLDVVQRLPYYPDPPGANDWIGDPRTVLRIGGDCEDLATLVVALWATAGLTARIQWIGQEGDQDHVSAQVQIPGAGWIWGEPTIKGARFGEYPYDAARRLRVGRGAEGRL